jgi:hypothetical protein
MLTPSSDATTTTEAPPPTSAWMPGQARVLTPEQKSQWDKRVDTADRFRKQFEPQWERGLERYSRALYTEDRTDVNALLDFSHVENKKSRMFHKTPEVQLTPVDPKDQSIPYAALLPLRQKYLNHKLGPKGAKAKKAFHKALVDALAASAWMVLEVGYENVLLPVPPDPLTGQPLGPNGLPSEVPIWWRCFLNRVSPMKALVPADFYDTDFDESPWLGVKGTIATSKARSLKWAIPAILSAPRKPMRRDSSTG